MDKRLQRIYNRIPDGIGVLDVGTDHGYLPVALCRRGYPGKLYASDVNADPLQKAVRHAGENGFEDRICFRLSDGLDGWEEEAIDCVVIAGMGGDTIAGILERSPWCRKKGLCFFLQPMSKAEVLRSWLAENSFYMEQEDLVAENHTLYQILMVRYGRKEPLSPAQQYLGVKARHCSEDLYHRHRRQLIARFERAIAGMNRAENRDMQNKIQQMESILNELRESE